MIFSFKAKTTTNYLKQFGDKFVHIETDKYFVAVYPNQFDDFRFFSIVNGIIVKDGGTHIEYIIKETVGHIKEKLNKKYKNLKFGDVKNKLFLVVVLKDVKDLTFSSQSKTAIMNSEAQIRKYLELDFVDMNKTIMKADYIIDPIVEIFKLKEEAKRKQELKELDTKRPKKIKNEKYTPPTRHYKRLYLCEGEAAKVGLIAGLGREDCGFLELRGVPLNSYEAPIQRIIKNDELRGIAEVLGMKWADTHQPCTFDEVVIAVDADFDGGHIAGLLTGFFRRFAPNYFTENRIKMFATPYMLVKNKDIIEDIIFDVKDAKTVPKGKSIKILKGLGSWNENEFDQMVTKYGLDHFIMPLTLDEEGMKYMDDWLKSENVEQRKEQICNFDFDINLV